MARRIRARLQFSPMTEDATAYGCSRCGAHICMKDDVIADRFHGRYGAALLISRCLNYYCGPAEWATLLTGVYKTREIFCSNCDRNIGWTYDVSVQQKEVSKVGRFVVQLRLIREIRQDSRFGSLRPTAAPPMYSEITNT